MAGGTNNLNRCTRVRAVACPIPTSASGTPAGLSVESGLQVREGDSARLRVGRHRRRTLDGALDVREQVGRILQPDGDAD